MKVKCKSYLLVPRVAERGQFWEVISQSYRLKVGPIEWKKKRKNGKRERK
jgi:hypothetical protein